VDGARDWLLLVYRIPREPTAPRVAVWRKLKRLGALLLDDAAWVLPARETTREQFRWLAAEIEEAGGNALVWEARLAVGQEEDIVEQFATQVEEPYQAILTDLARDGADLAALSRRYQHVLAQDYFQSALGARVRAALVSSGLGDGR
jgi:hypothetical protein